MKVAVAVFSLTNNTTHIASIIKENLEKAGHYVSLINFVNVVKCSNNATMITNTARDFSDADCVGAASLAWALLPPPRVVATLLAVLKQSQVRGKPCFSFCTAGGAPGKTNDALLDV